MSVLKKIGKILAVLVLVVLVLIGGYLVFANATADRRLAFPDAPYPAVAASQDPALIERGRYLVYGPAHCAACHSATDRAHPELIVPGIPLTGGLEFAMGPLGTFYAANLTSDAETGIGKFSDQQIGRAVRTGITHDGTFSFFMRFAVADLSDDDLGAVISFLRTQPAVSNRVPRGGFKLVGKALLPVFSPGPRTDPPPVAVQAGLEPTVERGKYLADHAALCVGCHTELDMPSYKPIGPKGAGGMKDDSHGADSDMEFVTPNLTADPTVGYTGRATEVAFLARMRSGRAITSSIMPWENIKVMTDSDLRSVYRYLKTLPPVKTNWGPSYRKKGSWPPKS